MQKKDLKTIVKEALDSGKVDPYMVNQYFFLLNKKPNVDLTKETLSCLAHGRPGLKFDGQISNLGTVYGILTTYEKFAELVSNPDLYSFEADR